MEKKKILIIDDEVYFCKLLKKNLELTGDFEVDIATEGKRGIRLVKEGGVGLVILDLKLPDIDGINVLKEVKKIDQYISVIILTGHGSMGSAISAVREGAYDYLTKPFGSQELIMTVKRGLENERLARENKRLIQELIRSNKELQKANEELKEAQEKLIKAEKLKAIGEVAVAVNHFINNPMTVISGNSQILLGSYKGAMINRDETGKYLKEIVEATEEVKELLGKLRDVAEPVSTTYIGDAKMLDLYRSAKKKELRKDDDKT